MSGGEFAYFILILAATIVFIATLAWETWHNS
jgi:hypothetical protein